MLTAAAHDRLWLQRAARAMDATWAELPAVALHARVAIADAARVCSTRRPAHAARTLRYRRRPRPFGATWSCSCSSTGSTRDWPPRVRERWTSTRRNARMMKATDFEQRYRNDGDPWRYRSSEYERANTTPPCRPAAPGRSGLRSSSADRSVFQRPPGAAVRGPDDDRLRPERGRGRARRARTLPPRASASW